MSEIDYQTLPEELLDHIDAAVFRRLLAHLKKRKDIDNKQLMTAAGFCRNCLSKWYLEEAQSRGLEMDLDDAQQRIYGKSQVLSPDTEPK